MQTEWLTTSTLLRDLRDYDNDLAWRRLVERFRAPIVAFARRVGLAPADADDAAQDTLTAFARAYREGRYDPARGRLSQWLFGIAYKQALRLRARAGRDAAREAGPDALGDAADPDSAAAVWDREWEAAIWRQCIERVQPEFEPQTIEAFELCVRDDRTAAEAAAQLGIPVKAVYNAKHRVLKRLRELRAEIEDAL